jgi:selenocysteine-specific elongation factor
MPVRGDRLVLRRLAPPDTIGGGVVLDARPRRHGHDPAVIERLRALERGEEPPEDVGSTSTDAADDGRLAAEAAPEEVALAPPALALAAMLRADGERPRADGDLATAAGISAGEAAKHLGALTRAGLAVRVAANLHFDPVALDALVARIVAICDRDGSANIADVRDELATTRRYAQALLEYMDTQRITRRHGDTHVLRRRRQS